MKTSKLFAVLAMSVCAAAAAYGVPVKVGNPGFPYSVPGSFLTVDRCEKGKYKCKTYSGLWIRNVSTCWKDYFCRLVPSVGDKDVEVTECVMRDGWLEAKTDKGAIEFAYLRPDVLLVRSKSSEMHIRFEYQRPRQKYDFPSTFGRTVDYMHFSADRILMDTRKGVRDPDGGNIVRVHPSKEGIEVAILDIHTGDWDGYEVTGSFEEAVAKQKASFDRMYASLPSVPKEFEWARHEAAILFWTTIAGPRGSLGNYPDLLLAECRDFLYFLDDHINSPDCAAAINDICQKEEAFVNFIKGLSGSDPNISQSEYSIRIDKFIHDLKELFRNLGHALTKFECSLGSRSNTLGETGGTLLQKRRAVRKQPIIAAEDSVKATRRKDTVAAVKEIRRRVKLGESYASAASYLKRNPAWKVRLSHIKAETLVRYAKDRKKTSEIESVNSSPESAAKEEIKSKSSMPKCGIIRGMRKSTKSAVAITLAIAGAIASPFSSNAAALDLRGGAAILRKAA